MIPIILILLVVYFLPTGLAYSRKHKNADAIMLLNLFLGWLLIPWVIALVWAETK